jgi:hypothetical protein
MTIELPPQIESAIKVHAQARGVSEAEYVRALLERELVETPASKAALPPFQTGYGIWSKYGVSISEKDIDENRADMFRNFGEDF